MLLADPDSDVVSGGGSSSSSGSDSVSYIGEHENLAGGQSLTGVDIALAAGEDFEGVGRILHGVANLTLDPIHPATS